MWGDLGQVAGTMLTYSTPSKGWILVQLLTKNFIFLNSWKNPKEELYSITRKSWYSNFSVHKSSLTGTQHAHSFTECFRNWGVLKETVWSTKPKIFTLWISAEQVCQRLFHKMKILMYFNTCAYLREDHKHRAGILGFSHFRNPSQY